MKIAEEIFVIGNKLILNIINQSKISNNSYALSNDSSFFALDSRSSEEARGWTLEELFKTHLTLT